MLSIDQDNTDAEDLLVAPVRPGRNPPTDSAFRRSGRLDGVFRRASNRRCTAPRWDGTRNESARSWDGFGGHVCSTKGDGIDVRIRAPTPLTRTMSERSVLAGLDIVREVVRSERPYPTAASGRDRRTRRRAPRRRVPRHRQEGRRLWPCGEPHRPRVRVLHPPVAVVVSCVGRVTDSRPVRTARASRTARSRASTRPVAALPRRRRGTASAPRSGSLDCLVGRAARIGASSLTAGPGRRFRARPTVPGWRSVVRRVSARPAWPAWPPTSRVTRERWSSNCTARLSMSMWAFTRYAALSNADAESNEIRRRLNSLQLLAKDVRAAWPDTPVWMIPLLGACPRHFAARRATRPPRPMVPKLLSQIADAVHEYLVACAGKRARARRGRGHALVRRRHCRRCSIKLSPPPAHTMLVVMTSRVIGQRCHRLGRTTSARNSSR